MKIYIGNQELEDKSFKCIKGLEMLDIVCDDSECTELLLDNILHKYSINNLNELVKLIVKKIRINSKIVITDIDFELLAFNYANTGDLLQLNQFGCPCESMLTMDFVIELFTSQGLELKVKNYNSLNFILELRRGI
jgi:hypothetical protein